MLRRDPPANEPLALGVVAGRGAGSGGRVGEVRGGRRPGRSASGGVSRAQRCRCLAEARGGHVDRVRPRQIVLVRLASVEQPGDPERRDHG